MAEERYRRAVEWVLSRLREIAPFYDLEQLVAEDEALADEIEEQSAGGLTREMIIEMLFEYYLDELLDMLYMPSTEFEEIERVLSEYVSQTVIERLREEWERRRRWL
jgi:hypothetical protein